MNPNRATVQGLPAYRLASPAARGARRRHHRDPRRGRDRRRSRRSARAGCRAAIVFTAGFAEVGEAAPRCRTAWSPRRARARHAAARAELPRRCSTRRRLLPDLLRQRSSRAGRCPGVVGIASQSGAYGSASVRRGAARAASACRSCVTTGNEADLTLGDIIEWMAGRRGRRHRAYAEGIRDGARFVAALEAARRARKPVVMMKVGRSAVGEAAAQVAHRLHRRRRPRDGRGAGRVRRGARAHDRGDARHRLRRARSASTRRATRSAS